MIKKEGGNDVDGKGSDGRDGKNSGERKEEEEEEEEEDQDEGVEEDQEPSAATEEEEVARSRMRRVKDRLRLGLFLSEEQLKLIDDALYNNVERGTLCVCVGDDDDGVIERETMPFEYLAVCLRCLFYLFYSIF